MTRAIGVRSAEEIDNLKSHQTRSDRDNENNCDQTSKHKPPSGHERDKTERRRKYGLAVVVEEEKSSDLSSRLGFCVDKTSILTWQSKEMSKSADSTAVSCVVRDEKAGGEEDVRVPISGGDDRRNAPVEAQVMEIQTMPPHSKQHRDERKIVLDDKNKADSTRNTEQRDKDERKDGQGEELRPTSSPSIRSQELRAFSEGC